jgi:hypothetical protein
LTGSSAPSPPPGKFGGVNYAPCLRVSTGNYALSFKAHIFTTLAAGHTHLAADGIHGLIEKKLRKKKDVYDFRDLCDILQSSQTKNEIIEMKINDFDDLENDIVTRTKQNNLPILSDIVQVRFTRRDRRMHYKKTLMRMK